MANLKIQELLLGPGDLESGTQSAFTSGTVASLSANGNDGDVYVMTAGANSNVFIKKNGQWQSLLVGAATTVSVPDNTANYVWLSLPVTAGRFFRFDYGAYRGGFYQRGSLGAVSDGSANAGIVDYGILTVGGSPGVTFDVSISGGNINFLATTTSLGTSLNLEYSVTYLN